MENFLLRAMLENALKSSECDDDCEGRASNQVWKNVVAKKALDKVNRAATDDKLRPEGRIALLKEALREGREVDDESWSPVKERRVEIFAQLERHIDACNAIMTAEHPNQILSIVIANVTQSELHSKICSVKNGTKVIKRLAKIKIWELCKTDIKERAYEEERIHREAVKAGIMKDNSTK